MCDECRTLRSALDAGGKEKAKLLKQLKKQDKQLKKLNGFLLRCAVYCRDEATRNNRRLYEHGLGHQEYGAARGAIQVAINVLHIIEQPAPMLYEYKKQRLLRFFERIVGAGRTVQGIARMVKR